MLNEIPRLIRAGNVAAADLMPSIMNFLDTLIQVNGDGELKRKTYVISLLTALFSPISAAYADAGAIEHPDINSMMTLHGERLVAACEVIKNGIVTCLDDLPEDGLVDFMCIVRDIVLTGVQMSSTNNDSISNPWKAAARFFVASVYIYAEAQPF